MSRPIIFFLLILVFGYVEASPVWQCQASYSDSRTGLREEITVSIDMSFEAKPLKEREKFQLGEVNGEEDGAAGASFYKAPAEGVYRYYSGAGGPPMTSALSGSFFVKSGIYEKTQKPGPLLSVDGYLISPGLDDIYPVVLWRKRKGAKLWVQFPFQDKGEGRCIETAE